MAVLEKIRVKFGLAISIIIALALLSFIIDPGTLQSAMQGMSSKYDVGKIAGRAIRYTDYQEQVERFTTIREVTSGTSAHSDQEQRQIRDAAWQDLVDKYLFVKNAKEAGITVGSAELLDLTTGDNPSPVILQTFGGPDGYDPQVLVDFVQNQVPADESGRLQTFWNYLQTTVNNQQYYTKYGALFTASAYLNDIEKADLMAKNNTTANVDYLCVTYPYQDDSAVVVSKSEIKKYYKAHKDFYEQKANRDIEYVVFEVVPSAEDVAAANEKITAVYDEFGATTNMKAFLMRNSDRQLSNRWYKAGELNSINRQVNDYVFSTRGSAPSPVFEDDNTFYSVRVMASANIPDSVYVKHILLQGNDAKATAEEVLAKLRRGGNFAALAAEYSFDKNSMDDGQLGNIGWMTQSYMIPGLESVITAKINDPYIVNTQYGTHVVMVSKRTAPVAKKQVAIFEKGAIASKETFGKYYSQANRFSSIAGKTYEGYKAAVDSLGVYSHQMNVNEGTSSYGSVDQAKEVTRWIFDAKKGHASNIITVNNKYFFITAVKEVHKEGVKPLDEVAQGIRQRLYFEKLRKVKTAEVAAKVEGLETLEQMAEALGVSITNEAAMSFSTTSSRGIDPALAGAAFAAEDGVVSAPVAGGMGTYIVRVNSRETGSFFTEEDALQQASQKAQYSTQMVLPVMSRIAEVKDNRERFF
ncbi:MAG: SurA N-terminal domain-containing protein [Bacteroidales bacterium]|nr:SurA N-terminal domain-containing protein [Bacteroidales bacterium]